MENKIFQRYIAIILIVILSAFVIYFLYPYIDGLFGAFIIFILFLPIFNILTNKFNINKKTAAILMIILTIIIIIIPTYFIVTRAYNEVTSIVNQDKFTSFINSIDEKYPPLNFAENVTNGISNWKGGVILNSINSLMHISVILIIMLFTLYFLFINQDTLKKKLIHIIPFNSKNSIQLANEFSKVTKATISSAVLVGAIQSTVLGLVLFMFGVPNAILWAIISFVFAFLPILDIFMVYIPIAVYYLAKSNYLVGIGILIFGLLISLSDYLLRPYFQRRFGNIHPWISIVGVFIGIPAFGLIGFIMGPLLLSYIMLLFDMFKDEYVKKKE